MKSRLWLLAFLMPVVASGQSVSPIAWPQFGGPSRDFRVDSTALSTDWSTGGPEELWRRPLGEGYSSILVDGGTLVTMYRLDDQEIVIGLDARTGATRWQYSYDAPLEHNGYFDIWLDAAGPGPYSTPTIARGVVFAVGVTGHFHALDLQTGSLLWSHDLVDTFELVEYNAFASSPLSYGSTIILPLGGSGSGVVAFDRETGAVAWRSPPFPLGPGSPVLIETDGRRELVVLGQQELVGLDPDDGQIRWRHPHENELGLNISMPVRGPDNLLFASSGYDGGSRMLRLTGTDGVTAVEQVWFNNRMRLHFGNAIRVGDLIIGSSGDFGPAFLTALNVHSGAEAWRDRRFGRAHTVYADGKLLIMAEDGELAIASVDLNGLRVHGRRQVLTDNAWTPPTLVEGILFIRDRKEIASFDLGE